MSPDVVGTTFAEVNAFPTQQEPLGDPEDLLRHARDNAEARVGDVSFLIAVSMSRLPVRDERVGAESQMRNELESHGYSETPGERSIEVIRDVACVRQAFTMNFADRVVGAVDVFLLSRTGGEWRILAVASDIAVSSPGS